MESRLFSEYKFKFYLNASHSIMINGKQGQVHPHTWEIVMNIVVERKGFVAFNVLEKELEGFIKIYQDRTLNDVEPFNMLIPTLENIVEYFGSQCRVIARKTGGELRTIEGSETPTRSYIISFEQDSEYIENIERASEKEIVTLIDNVVDGIIGLGRANAMMQEEPGETEALQEVEVNELEALTTSLAEENSRRNYEKTIPKKQLYQDDYDYKFSTDGDFDV